MGLITTILDLFGCSGQTKKDDRKLSKADEDQLAKSIDAFKNRPIYRELTGQVIDTTSDDNLLQIVFDNLSEKQTDNYEKEFEAVMSWNKSRQAIYMIWLLEAEVNNGGYNQFYFNSSGQFYKYLPDALRLIGANKFADLTERANKTFEKENDKITKHQDGTIEGFSKSYEDNPLNDFDTEFYELYKTENLQRLQVDFIRKNRNQFVDK
ncbi:MAG: DMP19 family protein [Chryseotalea sp. WA131a]|nr:MAG: DMP19 family protein [Chryseotalea sp. WA131a]